MQRLETYVDQRLLAGMVAQAIDVTMMSDALYELAFTLYDIT